MSSASSVDETGNGPIVDAGEFGAWLGFPNAAGRWLTIAVGGDVIWTNKVEKVRYREHDIWVLPPFDLHPVPDPTTLPQVKFARQIAFDVPEDMDVDEGWRLLFRFLSSLCWKADRGVFAQNRMGPGSRLIPIGGISLTAFYGRDEFPHQPLPAPLDSKGCLGVALYREARSAASDAYAYLNYYRILELVSAPRSSVQWIDDNLTKVKPRSPLYDDGMPNDLKGRSVGEFLYGLGRGAIAHAKLTSDYIDPDEPEQALRLSREVVVVRELAAHAIVNELKVPRR